MYELGGLSLSAYQMSVIIDQNFKILKYSHKNYSGPINI